jgi:hypothetical protein
VTFQAPRQIQRHALRNAYFMPLAMLPASPEAQAFVQAIANEIQGQGSRHNRRRSQRAQEAHRRAVGATLADLLLNWHRGLEESLKAGMGMIGGLSHRSLKKEGFTGQVVSWRAFKDVLTALTAANYVTIIKCNWTEFLTPVGDVEGPWSRRYASRLAPTDRLLRAAADSGVLLVDLQHHFATDPRASPKETTPVVIERLKVRRGCAKVKTGHLPLPATPEANWIVAQVNGFNEFAAQHRVELDGKRITPQWHREFNLNFSLHGRWYVRGDGYQALSCDRRVGSLTIDGAAVAEVDLSASWLTCLYGYLDVPFDPRRDPYRLRTPGRQIVKTWITASLGKGQALTGGRWPKRVVQRAVKEGIDLSTCKLSAVSRAILRRHPILADLPGRCASLAFQFRVARPQDVFALFLMGLEARAMTVAMMDLKERGVLALPVHDSLIVPQGAVEMAKAALTTAFQRQLDITPRLKVVPVCCARKSPTGMAPEGAQRLLGGVCGPPATRLPGDGHRGL